MSTQPRRAVGTPAGGQYATTPHPETGTSLSRPYAGHTPVQVDQLLAETYTDLDRQSQKIRSRIDSAHRTLGHRQDTSRGARNRGWPTPPDQALADLEAALDDGKIAPYQVDPARSLLADVHDLRAAQDVTRARIGELEAEHQARGWSRFFLVTSSAGGHIHSSRSCHTCRDTTEYGWLPQLSGQTEEAAVAEHGAILCTACYPTAPVEWTRGKPPAPDTCPGSNQQHAGELRRHGQSTYGACPVCGDIQLVGYSGVRKHKTPK